MACEILVPQGWTLSPQSWKCEVLTTGPPGMSPNFCQKKTEGSAVPRRSRGPLGRLRSEIRAVTISGHRVACIQGVREAGKGPAGS